MHPRRTRPRDFTRRREIEQYAKIRGVSFSEAVVELVNDALSHGALTEIGGTPAQGHYLPFHRNEVRTWQVTVSGLEENYLPWVVVDIDHDHAIGSHMSKMAASEYATAMNKGEATQ
jgi:hypothetical protein